MEDEFDNCIDDKLCVYETVISRGLIYEERCDTNNKQGNTHNYISIKEENIDDVTVIAQETELMSDCTDDKVCANKIVISGGYVKQEPCNMEQEGIQNYVDIKNDNIDDSMIVSEKIELMTNCADDKTSINGGGYIKQEPCSMKDRQGSIHNYVNIKNENIDHLTVVAQQTKLMTVCTEETIISGGLVKQVPCDIADESRSIHEDVNTKDENTNDFMFIVIRETELMADAKVNYFICCEECGEEYDLYCLKCPMLLHILDSTDLNGTDNAVTWTLPKNFIDICKTPSGVGVVALKAIPKGVIIGPFRGLDSTKDEVVSKWKLENKDLAFTKDPEWLNWMQYIKKPDNSSHHNLTPFQYEHGLYYRSDRYINVGDELLVLWNSDSKGNGIQDMEDGYWAPPVCENLDDSYACTLCCIGYKSINHLITHNSVCSEKRNKRDFGREIIQCDICKIYLDKKEYADYHMDLCYNSNKKFAFQMPHRSNRERPLCYHVETKQINCESGDMGFWNTRLFVRYKKEEHALGDKTCNCCNCEHRRRFQYTFSKYLVRVHDGPKPKQHIAIRNDDRLFACTLCSYKATTKSNLKKHIAIHNSDKPFACALCPFKTKIKPTLKRHVAIHNDDRPFACTLCAYKATTKSNLKQHIVTHNDGRPFACPLCPYKARTTSNLNQHSITHKEHRPFACTVCPYKARTNSTLKKHIAFHNGDKPFACTFCPYKTKRKSDLKQHVAVHNDDRPFACTFCAYKATTKSILRRHIDVHNNESSFACTFCPYKAKGKTDLKEHIAIHND